MSTEQTGDQKVVETLKRLTTDLRRTKQRLREAEDREHEPIAIVGMACRYPGGVESPEDLWRLVIEGRDAIGGFPTDRGWDLTALFAEEPGRPGLSNTREGGFVHEAGEFDPGFFGISPREALAMDPQQRLLLETAWEAVERAGIDPVSLRGSRTGVYAGVMYHDYGTGTDPLPEGVEGYLGLGTAGSVASGRVAYVLGLEGPAVTVDTACSSSLVALHSAVRALRAGECSMALAGGATVLSTPAVFVDFTRQGGLASDGRCKSYSAEADGVGWSEGAGMLLVERLADAERLGHPVLAVLRGSAVNQDGASSGLTTPNGPAQQRVIRQALADARLNAADVDFVEGHGTGTPLGDPIEAQALLATYGQERDEPLWLGSVKSNIGHTQAAAGVAGIIKAVYALRHGLLPGTAHLTEPSPQVDWASGAVEPLRETRTWPEVPRPRRAAVSSFGISGTNAHIVLEQAPAAPAEPVDRPAPEAVPVPLSAATEPGLRAQARRLAAYLADDPALETVDVAFSAATGRAALPSRAVVVADDRARLLEDLAALAEGRPGTNVVTGTAGTGTRRVAFVFPGQGAQWAGMAVPLAGSSPVFAAKWEECGRALAPWVDWSLDEAVRSPEELERVDVVQPVLWAVMVSLTEVWRAAGVLPDAVLGHSQGEIAAACVAGALSLEDGAKIVALRAKALLALAGRGGMLSVPLPESEVRARLAGRPGLEVAAVNGPSTVVVSGEVAALDEAQAAWTDEGVRVRRVPVDYASHSPQVEEIRDRLAADLAGITPRTAGVTFISTLTGAPLDTAELDTGYWYRNLREQVRFEEATRRAMEAGCRVFVEVSPHPVLTVGVQQTAEALDVPAAAVATLRRDHGDLRRFRTALAEAAVLGVPVDWSAELAPYAPHRVGLPTYAFQRERFWLTPQRRAAVAAVAGADPWEAGFWDVVDRADVDALSRTLGVETDEPLSAVVPALSEWHRVRHQRSAIDGWRYAVEWERAAVPDGASLTGTWLLVVPEGEEGGLPAATARALTAHGAEVTTLALGTGDTARATLTAHGGEVTTFPLGTGDAGHGGEVVTLTGDTARAALAERLAELRPAGVLSLLALRDEPHPGHPALPAGLALTVALVQALGDAGVTAPLWCATQGAVAAGPAERITAPAQSQTWGLGRVVALEHPDRWGGLIDLPAELDERASGRLAAVLAGAEDQVALRHTGVSVRRLVRAPLGAEPGTRQWRPTGTVLLTGGTGALGPHLVRWLAARGAERVVLPGRRGPATPIAAELIAELDGSGTVLDFPVCDVADRDQLAALVDGLAEAGTPVRSVFHAATALELRTLEDTPVEEFAGQVAAKVLGARHLDELFADRDLDAFVLFSSIAGVWGSGLHAPYAAANAYLDALAEDRRARGLPATSVAWGIWAAVNEWDGINESVDPERVRRQGLPFLDPAPAVEGLQQVLDHDETTVVLADVDWDRFVPVFCSARRRPLLEGVPEAAAVLRASAVDTGTASALRERLAALPEGERRRAAIELVREHAAAVLGHDSPSALPADRAFRDVGFDSITAVELRNRVAAATGLTLPATLVFDHPSPAALAGHLLAEAFGATGEAATAVAVRADDDDPVAIVGMSCRYAGGIASPDDLWRLVTDGEDAVGELPDDRGWDLDALYDSDPDARGRSYVRHGGFLADLAGFDAGFFGISPIEARATDPQQRMLLEAAWEAFEHAGIDPTGLRGSRTGVFAGANVGDYASSRGPGAGGSDGQLLTGNVPSVVSGRIAYTFGFEGPAVTVDTACSTALVALHLACQSVRRGESDLALAAGVALMSSPAALIGFSAQRGLSSDGRCKAFADAADGTGLAEGVGVLLVERLSRARARGHRVLALVRGSAINQDGASNGLTAPSGPAQQRVITAALADAGLRASEVDAVEAHGTGTRLGDPIEAQALLATYGRAPDRTEPLWLGSVKSNIGHSQAASGAAGVIKMVQATRHGVLPRTLHVDAPSTQVDWTTGAVSLLTEPLDWPDTGRPRRAGISSFGLSGTNAHVIIEQAPAEPAPEEVTEPGPEPVVAWPVHGRTATALRAQAARLRDHLADVPDARPADVGWALADGRAAFDHRAVVVGAGRTELLRGLGAVAGGTADPAVAEGVAEGADRVAFVFPGHGAQWPGMAKGLLEDFPVFRDSVLECAAAFEEFTDWSLLDVLRDVEGAPPLHRVDVVQPALFTMMVSLAALWRSYGVVPSAVAGHSQGEVAAAYVAGALDLRDAARIVATRGKAWLTLAGTGGMASVALPAAEVTERLRPWGTRLDIAAINDPGSVTVAGDLDALEELLTGLEGEGVRVRRVRQIVGAGHTAHVDVLRDHLTETLAPTAPRSSPIPFYSTVTGGLLDTAELDTHYWYRNARQTVRFEEAVRAMAERGHGPFLEVSGHPMFAVAIQRTLEEAEVRAPVLATLRRDEGGRARFLRAAAEAHAAGATVDWRPASEGTGARAVELPTYAFQHARHWLEASTGTGDVSAAGLTPAAHPLLGAEVDLAGGALVLTGRLSAAAHPWLSGDVPGSVLVDLALAAADRAGCAGIGDLTAYAPLTVPAGGLDVQVRVGEAGADGGRTVGVHTRIDGAWVRNAEGTLVAGAAPGTGLAVWPPEGAEPLEGVYDDGAVAPAWRVVRAAWRRGEDVYAEVILSADAAGKAHGFALHPVLLDAALHAVLDGDRGAVAWSGVRVHATGARAVRVRVEPTGPDTVALTIADPEGDPVLTADAVRLGPVAGAAGRIGRDALFRTDWVPVPIPAEAVAARWAVLGDDPLGAAEALRGLGHAVQGADGPAALTEVPDVAVICAAGGRDEADTEARSVVLATLAAVQAWLADDRFAAVPLVVLTHGAAADAADDLAGGAAWGLVRSAQSEHPDRFVLVDLDRHPESWRVLPAVLAAGEPQLALRAGEASAPRLARLAEPGGRAPWDRDGTVLVTGASGDLGMLVARHLVAEHGVRHLVLASRRGPAAPGADELLDRLREYRPNVTLAACDVADRKALAELLAAIPDEHPLTAVVHSASVLDDGVIAALTPERVDTALRPKAGAAWHLHELTRHLDLSAFVLFSSMAGTLGGLGQGNYAAGNAFLDALARHRRSRGLAATSVAWGWWAERATKSGHDVEGDEPATVNGMVPLSEERGLALFDAACRADEAVVAASALDLRVLRGAAEMGDELPALLRGLVRAPARRAAEQATASAPNLARDLAGRTRAEQEALLLDLVRNETALVLSHASGEEVLPHHRFLDQGFDSLAALKLRNRIATVAGLRLPATLVFDHPTPVDLARHLLGELAPAEGEGTAEFADEDAATAVLVLEELGQLDAAITRLPADGPERARIAELLGDLLVRWGK